VKFEPTAIPDVVLIRHTVHGDERGFFFESWNARAFGEAGLPMHFVQDNYSRSVRHTLRGLHYQVRHTQGKVVRVLSGSVFDVAVDLRRSSPTFGACAGVLLTAESRDSLWIPPGFAHGFLVLSESADFFYKCTDVYAPAAERTIRWDDQMLRIPWPLPQGVTPIVSTKDARGAAFSEAEYFP
jgi:dTDP-4-dehydrorhamnose 3,5-epimerase